MDCPSESVLCPIFPELSQACFDQKALDETVLCSADIHLVGRGPLTAQYTLVLDALNFCFWPAQDLEYEDLAKGLRVGCWFLFRSPALR